MTQMPIIENMITAKNRKLSAHWSLSEKWAGSIDFKYKKFNFNIKESNKETAIKIRRSKKQAVLNMTHEDEGIRELCKAKLGLEFKESQSLLTLLSTQLEKNITDTIEKELTSQYDQMFISMATGDNLKRLENMMGIKKGDLNGKEQS